MNNEEFKTSRLVSELLSPKISHLHQSDPTIDTFIIETKNRGNFSLILYLVTFKNISIPQNELPFVSEVLSKFENKLIDISSMTETKTKTVTTENVFDQLHQKLTMKPFFTKEISEEIEFISEHFFELFEMQPEKITNLDLDIIEEIISSQKLRLNDENQLLKFVNEIYLKFKDKTVIDFYRYIIFSNVESSMISEFLSVYDINDITNDTWRSISERLKKPINNDESKDEDKKVIDSNTERYVKQKSNNIKKLTFSPKGGEVFDGIIKYIIDQTNNNIINRMNITASSVSPPNRQPINVTLYEDQSNFFQTDYLKNSWICFDFKENKVNLTNYQIKSFPYGQNNNHPKTWVIEGSNDNTNWIILDEQKNCPYLNGCNVTHLFSVTNSRNDSFRYLRMRLTASNWNNCHCLRIDSFEIYGNLI